MKNTIENKARFFAQYWGQEVAIHCNNLYYVNAIMDKIGEHYYLELTPLSQITDEDAIALAKIVTYNPSDINYNPDNVWVGNGDENGKGEYYIEIGVGNCWEAELTITENAGVKLIYEENNIDIYDCVSIFDYLRSKRYALPFDGITVDELIEFGWAKLKTK